ncbi:hypothetical protein CBM2586_B130492 [Cupriavidus phytorum]|uniref:Uncharacterized protein n=1 Tax=Cupriavidus taiwanensis TaxID=164546 RepID=A0A975XIS4_9BURK|nr:hypothetical protein CBM2586_B130492 [Cupriavidus taiwanensis]
MHPKVSFGESDSDYRTCWGPVNKRGIYFWMQISPIRHS